MEEVLEPMLDVTAGRRTDISDSWNETSTRTRLGLDEEEESEKPILEGKKCLGVLGVGQYVKVNVN